MGLLPECVAGGVCGSVCVAKQLGTWRAHFGGFRTLQLYVWWGLTRHTMAFSCRDEHRCGPCRMSKRPAQDSGAQPELDVEALWHVQVTW